MADPFGVLCCRCTVPGAADAFYLPRFCEHLLLASEPVLLVLLGAKPVLLILVSLTITAFLQVIASIVLDHGSRSGCSGLRVGVLQMG
jgi:hypothetical protein